MLNECRQALHIKTDKYDGELCSLMKAAVADLRTKGVIIPGTVSFTQTVTTAGTSYTDNSSLKEDLVKRAIFTYVRMHFGSPPDYEQLADSYDAQRTELMYASDYTDYESGGDGE